MVRAIAFKYENKGNGLVSMRTEVGFEGKEDFLSWVNAIGHTMMEKYHFHLEAVDDPVPEKKESKVGVQ